MRIKNFYYCVLYLLHIRVLEKLSSMEASQQLRSRRSKSIFSIRTKLTPVDGWVSSWWYQTSHYSTEKGKNGSFTGNSKHKNLTCNYYHKKAHIRSECWLWKKKQSDTNVTELIGEDEQQCDVLSVTDRSVGNKDRWVINSKCSQHIVPIGRCSLYTLRFKGKKSSWKFCYKQGDWRKNNQVSVSWWMHHYS